MIAPYIHIPWTRKVGEIDFGPEADNKFDGIQLRWFDHWLKGMDNGIDREPPVSLFVMGANAWREAADWPVPGTQFTSFYLTSEGAANSGFGNGSLSRAAPAGPQPADHFVYDPANPVPSRGGNSCCSIAFAPVGPYDQAAIEQRSDVLVYTTPPLSEAVEVTGPVTVDLYAASSAVDTDFTAKLVDVYPDGKAFNISQGIVRARYRNSLEKATPLTPGDVTAFKIALTPTSNVFKSGHRIRLEISSSNFPHYDRNLNTGAPIASSEKMKRARQSVYHDPQRLSRIVLPIMPQPLKAE
jgi:putative CocE/NonD family hydrolase